jgi:hydroxymethylpyrimidine pyrophosphatase-like HAD family hydrolase
VGDREAADAFVQDFRAAGYDLGWGAADLVNRWRETEIAVSLELPRNPIDDLAADHGLAVVDTGYAYHVKSPDMDKGTALAALASDLDRSPAEFVAVGDSENDAPLFDHVDRAVAVGNADATARERADHVTDAGFADGFLQAVRWLTT